MQQKNKILLLDGYSSRTLACVRSFGRKMIPFAVGGRARYDMSLLSRYAKQTFVYTSPFKSISKFLEDINAASGRFKANLILPTSEAAILACTMGQFRYPAKVLIPSPAQIELLFNKKNTLALAESCGVSIPRTMIVRRDSLHTLTKLDWRFPCVIKASKSVRIAENRIVHGGSTVYIYNIRDLLRETKNKLESTEEILLQEFIDGFGLGVSGVFRGGRPVALFGHRRLHESKPTGGPSAVAVSILVSAEMRETASAILGKTDYTGPAMVEFRVDRKSGKAFLMEVNCRFWGSVLLPMAAGIDLPYIYWNLIHDRCPGREQINYRIGIVGRYLIGDTKYLMLALKGHPDRWVGYFPSRREALFGYIRLFFDPQCRELLLSKDDPLPFLGRILQEIRL